MEPKPGRYDDVSVFDYNSLYPNVIRTWNIGTEDDTMLYGSEFEATGDDWRNHELSHGATPNAEVYYTQERPSMLAHAVGMFLDGRAAVRTKMKVLDKQHSDYKNLDLQQKVWKILANSTYGILGSVKTRYFNVDLAESITHGGRVALMMAVEWFEWEETKRRLKEIFNVLYGDTDSIFVQLGGVNPEDVLPQFHRDIYEWLRSRWGCKSPTIQLGFETRYRRLILAGKKHYFGQLDDGTFNGMGMDHKKRSTIPIARRILKQLFEHLIVKDEGVGFYDAWIRRLRKKVLQDPISRKQLDEFVVQQKVQQDTRARCYLCMCRSTRISRRQATRSGFPSSCATCQSSRTGTGLATRMG
jgi:DNA polymerase elongation subunit (family B)